MEFQKWRVYDGKWNSKNGCVVSLAVVLAVNFGGSILRGAWRPPPRAGGARGERVVFCHFCQKSGLFLSSFVKISSKISQSD